MRQYLHGISIHALVKRATLDIIDKDILDHFNPRPRKEGDPRIFLQ